MKKETVVTKNGTKFNKNKLNIMFSSIEDVFTFILTNFHGVNIQCLNFLNSCKVLKQQCQSTPPSAMHRYSKSCLLKGLNKIFFFIKRKIAFAVCCWEYQTKLTKLISGATQSCKKSLTRNALPSLFLMSRLLAVDNDSRLLLRENDKSIK